jgi:hypothetical protein
MKDMISKLRFLPVSGPVVGLPLIKKMMENSASEAEQKKPQILNNNSSKKKTARKSK